MPTTRTLAVAALVVGLFAVVLACGVATDGAAADKIPPSVTTLMAGWEQKFTLEWTVVPEPEGTRRVRGYVVSRYGQRAEPVRVLGRAVPHELPAVIGAGTILTGSTPIYDLVHERIIKPEGDAPLVVPEGAVVVEEIRISDGSAA